MVDSLRGVWVACKGVDLLICRRAVASFLCALVLSTAAGAQTSYRILDTWKLSDPGWWDYLTVDSAAHRLYITRGDHVDIVDTQTGALAGTIAGLKAVHGVALDTAGKFGYITDGGANAIVVFDRASLATVATIPVGAGADAIAFEPATQTVWSFNGRDKSATVVDAASRTVVATVALPGRPEAAAVDGHGFVYDNIEDKNALVRIDAHTHAVTATWPIARCDSPSGITIDAAGQRVFSVCDGKAMGIVDLRTGKTLATAAIGNGPDAAAFSPSRHLAFASCGEGVLAIVNAAAAGYPTLQMLATQPGARTVAYDEATDRAYLVTAQFGPRPAPTAANPRPRPPMIPGTFTVIVVGR